MDALGLGTVKAMNKKERTAYFNKYAGFIPDAPTQ